jgi:hypothetical protein
MPATKKKVQVKVKLPAAGDAVRNYLAQVGSLGGKQRAKNLSSDDLQSIARKGARARWKTPPAKERSRSRKKAA